MRIMWKEIAWMGVMLEPTLSSALLETTNCNVTSQVQRFAFSEKGVGRLSCPRCTAWILKFATQMHGQFESLVPLLMYHQKIKPQEAVDRTTAMIHDSYGRFYKKEQALYEDVDPEHLDNLKACVQVFKDLVMCNLHWR